jgi:hypothetical protein
MVGRFDCRVARQERQQCYDLAQSAGLAGTRFEVSLVGVRRDVGTERDLLIPTVAADSVWKPDPVILLALGEKTPEALEVALARPDEWIRGRLRHRS